MVSARPEPLPARTGGMDAGGDCGAARTAGIIDEIDGVPLHLKLKAWQEGALPLSRGGRCGAGTLFLQRLGSAERGH